ncbi:MAG: hypothetical protein WA990_10250 [Rubrobacteraceae bacterium]
MTTPEPGGTTGRKGSLLGVAAYLLVPGGRRARAAGHFRKAGFEALKGFGALARSEKPPESGATRRQKIDID